MTSKSEVYFLISSVGQPSPTKKALLLTPSYKQLIPGSERLSLGTYFFFRFSPRLSENHHSQVISIANFGPTATIWRYFVHIYHVFSLKSAVFAHEGHLLELKRLIQLKIHGKYSQNSAKWKLWAKIRNGNDLGMVVLT